MTPCLSEPRTATRAPLAALLGLLLLAGAAAGGTTTRLDALAGDDVVVDAGDPLRWFGSLADAGHLLYVAAGEFRPDAAAGSRFTRHGIAVLAGPGPGGGGNAAGLAVFGERPDRSFQALLGRRLGKLDLGVSVARVSHEAVMATDDGDAAWWARDVTLGAGLRWEVAPTALLDAAVTWTAARRRLDDPAAGASTPPVDHDAVAWTGARLRACLDLGGGRVLVPVLAWTGSDRPDRVAAPDGVYRRIADTYDLRLGLLLLPDPDTLWQVTLGRRFARTVLRDPVVPPGPTATGSHRLGSWLVRLGWERRVSPWWSLRCGGTLSVSDPDGTLPGAAAASFVRCDVVAGVSLHLGELVLDLAAGDDPPALPSPDEAGDPLAAPRAWTSVTLSAPF